MVYSSKERETNKMVQNNWFVRFSVQWIHWLTIEKYDKIYSHWEGIVQIKYNTIIAYKSVTGKHINQIMYEEILCNRNQTNQKNWNVKQ